MVGSILFNSEFFQHEVAGMSILFSLVSAYGSWLLKGQKSEKIL